MRFLALRRRAVLGFALTIALTSRGFAQSPHSISGQITDTSGGVIEGARVKVTIPGGTSRNVVTDVRGQFSIEGLPTGEFVVEVARPQFAPATVSVQLSDSAPRADVRVVLQPAPLSESLTVVGTSYAAPATTVGSKVPVSIREVPNSVSVLTRTQMNDQNMVTPWQALSQLTGVTAISNDNSQSQYHARGAALELQLDGVPSAQALGGNQQYDLAIYERIEIQRGPTGVLQGAGAISGAVNLVRRQPTRQASGSAFLSTGSWNNYHAEASASGPLSSSLRGLAVVAATNRDFFYDRTDDQKWLGYGALEWEPGSTTRVGASIIHQDDNTPGFYGLPTYTDGAFLNVPRSFNPLPDWNRNYWGTTDIGGEVEQRFGRAWTLVGKVNRRSQELLFREAFPSSGVDRVSGTLPYERRDFTNNFTSDSADTYLNGHFRALVASHQWLIGANVARYQNVGRGVNSGDDPTLTVRGVLLTNPPAVPEPAFTNRRGSESRTLQSGVYTMLRTRLGTRLSTVLGGRWSNFENRNRIIKPSVPTDWTVGAKSTMHFTPHAGAVVDVARDMSLYASYSEIFVAQTQTYVDGRVLDPRIGGQWEVGAKGEHLDKRLQTALAAFRIRDRNRAFADPLNPGFFVPLGEVESRGWEAEVTGRVARAWDVSTGYTWLQTKYLTHQTLAGQPLNYWYPRHSLKAWSNWRVPSGVLQGLKVGAGVQAYSSSASGTDTRNAAGVITVAARRQGAYAVAGLNLAYPLGRKVQVGAQVNNLFDRAYYTRLGGTNTYNLVRGASQRVGLPPLATLEP